jgi:hypothetical protein
MSKMKDMLIEVEEAIEAKGQFLTAKDLVIVLQESLDEAVKDMPEAEQAEAKLAILNMFSSSLATA